MWNVSNDGYKIPALEVTMKRLRMNCSLFELIFNSYHIMFKYTKKI